MSTFSSNFNDANDSFLVNTFSNSDPSFDGGDMEDPNYDYTMAENVPDDLSEAFINVDAYKDQGTERPSIGISIPSQNYGFRTPNNNVFGPQQLDPRFLTPESANPRNPVETWKNDAYVFGYNSVSPRGSVPNSVQRSNAGLSMSSFTEGGEDTFSITQSWQSSPLTAPPPYGPAYGSPNLNNFHKASSVADFTRPRSHTDGTLDRPMYQQEYRRHISQSAGDAADPYELEMADDTEQSMSGLPSDMNALQNIGAHPKIQSFSNSSVHGHGRARSETDIEPGLLNELDFQKLHSTDPRIYRIDPAYNVEKSEDGKFHCPIAGCDHPEKSFQQRSQYNKHIDAHIKPFSCPACPKVKFASTGCFNRHIRDTHIRDPKSQFYCSHPGCDRTKSFPREYNLEDHLKRVHGIPPRNRNGRHSRPAARRLQSARYTSRAGSSLVEEDNETDTEKKHVVATEFTVQSAVQRLEMLRHALENDEGPSQAALASFMRLMNQAEQTLLTIKKEKA